MDKKELEALKQLPFEKALEELEGIVNQMEGGQLALDDMMKAYEKGQVLSAVCGEKLKSIEKKVEVLRKKANGEEEWEDFDANSEQTASVAAPETPGAAPAPNPTDNDQGAAEELPF